MTRRSRLAVLGAVCAVALSTSSPAAQQPGAGDSREIAAYRLTASALAKVVNVNRAMVQQMMQDPKVQEARKIEDEIDALEKKAELTGAEDQRLEALRARQEELDQASDNPLGGDARSLSEMEARIRKYPPLVQALQKEGMTPREYATFWLTFIQAAFAQGFKKAGMLKELPPEVNPENVKFLEDHAAEISAMQKEFEVLGRKR